MDQSFLNTVGEEKLKGALMKLNYLVLVVILTGLKRINITYSITLLERVID